jgi:cytochrome bd-type quinol oxidase subunit 2
MRKTLAILLAATTLVTATAANAQWRDRRDYGHSGGGWVAPLVGGMIVGGIIGGAMASQPRYNDDYYYHTECRRERVFDQWGNFIGFERRCYRVPN